MSDIGRIINFDNKNYLLVSRINDNDDTYVYLMSETSPLNILIAKEKISSPSLIELTVIEDEEEQKRIYNLFLKWARLGVL